MHHYQRRRTSISGFGLWLQKFIETVRLAGVVMARLILLFAFLVASRVEQAASPPPQNRSRQPSVNQLLLDAFGHNQGKVPEDLHQSCPTNTGDWYFTGDYPTPGGNMVVNRAFMNYMEGKNVRGY
jgi:hypothetical protein